jgi:hypothetical protein
MDFDETHEAYFPIAEIFSSIALLITLLLQGSLKWKLEKFEVIYTRNRYVVLTLTFKEKTQSLIVKSLSPYRAVNTHPIGYKNKLFNSV